MHSRDLFYFLLAFILFLNAPAFAQVPQVSGPFSPYPPPYNPYLPNPHGSPATTAATASGVTASSSGTATVATRVGQVPVPVNSAANIAKARIAAGAARCLATVGGAVACAAVTAAVQTAANYKLCYTPVEGYPYWCKDLPASSYPSVYVYSFGAAYDTSRNYACTLWAELRTTQTTPGYTWRVWASPGTSGTSCQIRRYDPNGNPTSDYQTASIASSRSCSTISPYEPYASEVCTVPAQENVTVPVEEAEQTLQQKMDADFNESKRLVDAMMRDQADAVAAGRSYPDDIAPVNGDTPVTVSAPPVTTPEKTVKTESKELPDGSTDTTTTKEKVVVTPTVTGSTVNNTNITYKTSTVITNTTVNNVTNQATTTTTTINEPDAEDDQDYSFIDPTLPEVPELYEQKYPDGLGGVWQAKKPNIETTPFWQGVQGMFPTFSGGSCPAWSLSFDIGALGNFGTGQVKVECWIWEVIGLLMLITATFTARKIIF